MVFSLSRFGLHTAITAAVKAERAIFEHIDLEAEAAADARSESDIKAGRVVDHEAVSEWLGRWGTPQETPAPAEWLE